MMQQYARAKRDHRDAILLFRLGDFYEMFASDAEEASRMLGLTLTARQGVPMCGVPHHAARGYIARLLAAGRKVAICEQVRLPEGGRGLAEREVTEVITPGTATESEFLKDAANNFILAVAMLPMPGASNAGHSHLVASYADVSTGEWLLQENDLRADDPYAAVARLLARIEPREILAQESMTEDARLADLLESGDRLVNRIPDWSFSVDDGVERLKRHFGVHSLKGFGISDEARTPAAAAVLMEYVQDTAQPLLSHLRTVSTYREERFVGLDQNTQNNLELIRNLRDGTSAYTLVEVLDYTRTPIGKRRLVQWIHAPLRDVQQIRSRLSDVQALFDNQRLLSQLREALAKTYDLERLAGRLSMERAHAKDLLAIAATIRRTEQIISAITDAGVVLGSASIERLLSEQTRAQLTEAADLIERAIAEDPSTLLTEGRLIRRGYSGELDSLHEVKDHSEQYLSDYLASERDASGIASLKLKFNRVLGRFLEVTKANASRVPQHFIPRQSLTTCDRFTTERLAELESRLNEADERIVEFERDIFLQVRARVAEHAEAMSAMASVIGVIDVLAGLAYAAGARDYRRPEVDESTALEIEGGRHPVVEAHLPAGSFVHNSITLDEADNRFALITGPNMAGKSTILRQTALIVLMAQIGSFVPADRARLGVVDRVFCRVGASDNLARGESTFLVEMSEAAYILRTASQSSLIIMDEIGRGTSTSDGLAIAQAVAEYLAERIRARTLFATHFHELSALSLPGFFNLSMQVRDQDGKVVFLRSVQPGPSSNSYGVHVARIAGVPEAVVARADSLLESTPDRAADSLAPEGAADTTANRESQPRAVSQRSLFPAEEVVAKRIRSLDLDTIRPIDALNELAALRDELDRDADLR